MAQDLRVRRTLESIRSAFCGMILETDFEHITVAELCRRAKINKKTFYHYYESLDTLLGALQSDYSSRYLKTIEGLRIPRDIGRTIRAFFEYSAAEDAAYEKITCAASYRTIRQEMINTVMGATWEESEWAKSLSPFRRGAVLTFWGNTVLDLYKEWVESGKAAPLDDVIKLATDLVCGGLGALGAGE